MLAWISGRSYRFALMDGRRTVQLPSTPLHGRPRKDDQYLWPLLSLSADGKRIAYGAGGSFQDGAGAPIRIWDTEKHRAGAVLDRPGEQVDDISLATDGRRLALALDDSMEIWDSVRGHRLSTLRDPGVTRALDSAGGLVARPDGHQLLIGDEEIIDLTPGPHPRKRTTPTAMTALAFSPDGRYFASADDQGRTTLWDGTLGQRLGVLSGTESRVHAGGTEQITALAFSHDSATLATGAEDGTIQLWDTASRRRVGTPLATPGDTIHALSFSPHGRTLQAVGQHQPHQQYPLTAREARTAICSRTAGGLTRADRATHIPELPYKKTC